MHLLITLGIAASVLLVVGLFAGWTYLIWVLLFIFLFVDEDKTIKSMIIRVISLLVACLLLEYGWELIEIVINFIKESIYSLFDIILLINDEFEIPKFFLTLFEKVIPIFTDLISMLVNLIVLITKLIFIINILSNKYFKPIIPLNKFFDMVFNFISEKFENLSNGQNNQQQFNNIQQYQQNNKQQFNNTQQYQQNNSQFN